MKSLLTGNICQKLGLLFIQSFFMEKKLDMTCAKGKSLIKILFSLKTMSEFVYEPAIYVKRKLSDKYINKHLDFLYQCRLNDIESNITEKISCLQEDIREAYAKINDFEFTNAVSEEEFWEDYKTGFYRESFNAFGEISKELQELIFWGDLRDYNFDYLPFLTVDKKKKYYIEMLMDKRILQNCLTELEKILKSKKK